MNYETHQVSQLLDTVYKEIKDDIVNIFTHKEDPKYIVEITDSDGKLDKLRFIDKEKTFRVTFEKGVHKLCIELYAHGISMEGTYDYEYVMPFLWSKVWWKWKRVDRLLMKNLNRIRNIEAEMKRRREDEKFNMIYTTIFPDELNKILLGGKDD